ncbi:MAG: twin-arginine translocation signal domain-containing protein, partial [Verrucomicrobiae bacterium]|nr:twin-arginine translocation signal domain-containing protein [Verrucomicrobiae bacterium]
MAYVRLNRRRFLQQSAAVTAGLFTVVPRHVLGGAGHLPPSETLNIAGIGRRGYVDLVEVSPGGLWQRFSGRHLR